MILTFVSEIFLDILHGEQYWTPEFQFFYLNIYLIIFILVASGSIYLSRRFSWKPMMNATIIYLVGIFIIFLWEFYYQILGDPSGILSQPSYGQEIRLNPVFILLLSIIPGQGAETTWITSLFRESSLIRTGYGNLLFFTPEIKAVKVIFADILGIVSIPYYLLSNLSQLIIFSMIFFYIGLKFISSVQRLEGQLVEKNVFSERLKIPTYNELLKDPEKYILVRNFEKTYPDDPEDIVAMIPEFDKQIQREIEKFEIGQKLVHGIHESPMLVTSFCKKQNLEMQKLLDFLKEIQSYELGKYKPFMIYNREYGYTYEEVTLDSLHIMMVDGRACFVYEFGEKSKVEPALVSGLFAAITSFAKEAVKSEEALRSIDHGDTYLTIEYGKYIFGAIFSSGQSPTVRKNLRKCLDAFEEKHADELPDWLGDMSIFEDSDILVEDIFKPGTDERFTTAEDDDKDADNNLDT
jgi:hypothetical protein